MKSWQTSVSHGVRGTDPEPHIVCDFICVRWRLGLSQAAYRLQTEVSALWRDGLDEDDGVGDPASGSVTHRYLDTSEISSLHVVRLIGDMHSPEERE